MLPQPTGVTLRAACTDRDKVLWVVGDGGLLGRFGPDGRSLSPVDSGTTEDLRQVACCAGQVAAIGEAGQVVVHATGDVGPGGAGTFGARLPGAPRLTDVACLKDGGLVLSDAGGAVWLADRGGRGPELGLRRVPAPHPLFAVHVAGSAILGAGPRGAIARTTDAGVTWQAVGLPPGSDEAPTGHVLDLAGDGRHVVAVGRGGLYATSTDHGATFKPEVSGTTRDLSAVVRGGPREVHALAGGNRVAWLSAPRLTARELGSQYHGLAWHEGQPMALGIHGRIARRAGEGPASWQTPARPDWRLFGSWTDGRTLIVVGERGLVLRSAGGGPLTRVPTPIPWPLYAVTGDDHGTLLAVGEHGGIARSGDGGLSWQAIKLHDKYPLVDVWLDDVGHAVAVGQGGLRFVSRDAGLSWKPSQPNGKDQELTGLAVDGRRLWVTGSRGFLERSDDFGRSWYAAEGPGPTTDLRTPLVTSAGSLIATSFTGEVHRRGRDGRWVSQMLAEGSRPSAIAERRGQVFIATTDGRFFVSRDDGRTFAELRGPGRVLVNSLEARPDGLVMATGLDGALLTLTP